MVSHSLPIDHGEIIFLSRALLIYELQTSYKQLRTETRAPYRITLCSFY